MVASDLRPRTLEERIVYGAIVGTWGFWLLGALYVVAPMLGYMLVLLALGRRLGLLTNATSRDKAELPLGTKVWNAFMAVMALGLVVGHLDYNLGFAQTLKSFIGWMKGWALLAVFIYAGATLRIRPEIVYRATNRLALHTLIVAPVFFLAAVLHLPQKLYVSPLSIVGGPGPEYFSVVLYGIDPETHTARWRFFSPWSPAAAFVANLAFVFALYERDRFWRYTGYASNFVVCAMTQSRMAIIAVPIVVLLTYGLSNLTRQFVFFLGTSLTTSVLPFLDTLSIFVIDAVDRFNNARASSSRVRSTLQSIAQHRWWNEAPIWGHGIVEKGPHLVEYMPIGSHHTWNGLLYVKGLVGFIALAIPMAWTIAELLIKCQADRTARAALGIMMILLFYSFGENLEILAYLCWPGLLVVGIATRRRLVNPWHRMCIGAPDATPNAVPA